VKWTYRTGGPIYAGVTIGADEHVHIACYDGVIYTLDPCGVELWRVDAGTPLMSVAASVGRDGTLYVSGENGRLYAIDGNGQLSWTHDMGGWAYGAPAVTEDGGVYVGSLDGTLYALGENGGELWHFEVPGMGPTTKSILSSPTIGKDGSIYMGAMYSAELFALDPCTGTVRWTTDFSRPSPADPCEMIRGSIFVSPIVAEDGTIYVSLLNNTNLYAVDPCDGSIIWQTELADPCEGWFEPGYLSNYRGSSCWSEPVLGSDGTIYVSFDDPYLRAVDPCQGRIKWVTRLGMVGGFTMAVGQDGLIYAASDDGQLYVVDPCGVELARFEGDDWLVYPVIAGDGTLYICGADMVWAIATQGCDGEEERLHRPWDVNGDRVVNLGDFEILAGEWLMCTDPDLSDPDGWPLLCTGEGMYLRGDLDRDMYVDIKDMAALAEKWLEQD